MHLLGGLPDITLVKKYATGIRVVPVASHFVNMYFVGGLRYAYSTSADSEARAIARAFLKIIRYIWLFYLIAISQVFCTIPLISVCRGYYLQ